MLQDTQFCKLLTKRIKMKYITCVLVLFTISISAQTKTNVQPFLETIASQFPNVRDIALNADQSEAVFSAQSVMGDISALVTVKNINGSWSTPQVISFSGQYFDIEPFFSADGLTLYFASNRPLDNSSTVTKDFDIWYVTRATVGTDWSEPINLGSPINTSMDEFYPIITASKNFYFTLDNPELKEKDNIYVSEFIEGKYATPKALGSGINSEGYEFNAFVADDESYMIYTCYNRKDGFGSGDLYFSTKLSNGEWSASKNMGEAINSDKMDYCPFVANNSLYFTSKRIGIQQDTNKTLNFEELQLKLNAYSNGSSRLYKVSISEFLNKN